MSATIARRLARVEGDRLAGAITHFADYWDRLANDLATVAADTAALAAADDGDTPLSLALWDVIELTTHHPDDQRGIRAALATVAPFVALTPQANPLAILAALEGLLARSSGS